MARTKTDFRQLRAKRQAALVRPELRGEPKPKPEPPTKEEIEKAIKAGKFRRV
ncbi:hypothetical protein [Rhizobium ruizarguesonis]|uniref:hypothetical protein n=1 Tax=Rhizobium ruizarguesonis TaxID=2081791 RepID=UPI0013EE50FE|nr:hypothetical protein [Rhizobium ruizarguesonis]